MIEKSKHLASLTGIFSRREKENPEENYYNEFHNKGLLVHENTPSPKTAIVLLEHLACMRLYVSSVPLIKRESQFMDA